MARAKTMEIRKFILQNVTDNPSNIIKKVTDTFQISRQAAHKHVVALINKGVISAKGATKSREYFLALTVNESFGFKMNKNLAEDKVWRDNLRNIMQNLPENVLDICHFGFTEMFNNVIDHSECRNVTAGLQMDALKLKITVSDDGIGIFDKIKNELNLEDPRHAILELAKGKLTTDPKNHAGWGIFYTSRMFDGFSILSGNHYFSHGKPDNDWLIKVQEKTTDGTYISMEIALETKLKITEVFDRYETDPMAGFNKTHVPVSLLPYADENLVSRSQAKRLLVRFNRFKEVFLDFKGVDKIGQAFADEIFRVFAIDNPQIEIKWANANAEVEKMIQRVLKNRIS